LRVVVTYLIRDTTLELEALLKDRERPGVVVHIYNPGHWGGGDQKDHILISLHERLAKTLVFVCV
jgi:hypothetical protein